MAVRFSCSKAYPSTTNSSIDPPHSDIVSQDKRFEVDGAHAARRFLKENGNSSEWDKHRLQLVWDAIALHTIGSVVFEKEPECQACSYGIWADFQGPDRVQGGLLTWDEYNAIVKVRQVMVSSPQQQLIHCTGIPETRTHERPKGQYVQALCRQTTNDVR